MGHGGEIFLPLSLFSLQVFRRTFPSSCTEVRAAGRPSVFSVLTGFSKKSRAALTTATLSRWWAIPSSSAAVKAFAKRLSPAEASSQPVNEGLPPQVGDPPPQSKRKDRPSPRLNAMAEVCLEDCARKAEPRWGAAHVKGWTETNP